MSGTYTNGLPPASLPLTGNELLPADTQLASGLAPESESISVAQLKLFAVAPLAVPYAASLALDTSLSDSYIVGTLTGNLVLANPVNLVAGKVWRVELTQDGTGSRLVTFGNLYTFSGSSTVSTTANYTDVFTFFYDGTKIRGTLATHFA